MSSGGKTEGGIDRGEACDATGAGGREERVGKGDAVGGGFGHEQQQRAESNQQEERHHHQQRRTHVDFFQEGTYFGQLYKENNQVVKMEKQLPVVWEGGIWDRKKSLELSAENRDKKEQCDDDKFHLVVFQISNKFGLVIAGAEEEFEEEESVGDDDHGRGPYCLGIGEETAMLDDDADDCGQRDGEGEGAQNEVDALPVIGQQPLRFPPSSHLRPLHAVTGFS